MADFFTDSDDHKAVEELLSQVMDATVLEQVAAVNCAGFNDDGLPSRLQTRFQKLKSFPSSAANPTKSFNLSHANDTPNQAKPPLVSSEEEKGAEKNVENQPTKRSTEVPDENRSASPAAKGGCFLCSPKKASRKKNKENRGFDCGKSDELLSDLSNFSVRSQRRLMKKAMEEERISWEAEKIVKWAKQTSARMEFSGVEDELSDDDNAKFA
ncbi:hypothetical protein SASPL_140945 [Salvia splendens]|uniref:Uncharacterized protein n=1 Tax=Salvia splendens TaxID=180675 RepID=A0A8X8ZCY3_SALSN|nr:uncharacterized protein LOC121766768 [Salvia splendens]KAG6399464.1 hypothetical protein SASPL_140945 [Salvia splendens]